MPSDTTDRIRFSDAIRQATTVDHRTAEQSPFVDDLLGGRLGTERYACLVAQHRAIYAMLEDAAAAMAGDPVAGPFAAPELTRLPALDDDLARLAGPDPDAWPAVLPATTDYVTRLQAVCFDWPGGFVAHHYTRYLGDLSGGQAIRQALERAHGADAAVAFYRFDAIGDASGFKDRYRALLDTAPWDDDERARIVAEIQVAYALNTEVLRALC